MSDEGKDDLRKLLKGMLIVVVVLVALVVVAFGLLVGFCALK
jgi:hypothetical protein